MLRYALALVFASVALATETVPNNSATHPLVFFMADSADHITGKTGLSPTVTLSKAGGSFSSPTGAVSEMAHGFYKVAGHASDTSTLGPLILHATATGADPADVRFVVVAYDDQLATWPTNVTQWSGTNVGTPDTAGYPKVTIKDGTGQGEIQLTTGIIDVVETLNSPVAGIASGGIQAATFAAGAIDAAAIAADAIGASEIAAGAIGASELAADAIGASELATDAVAEIADQVWDEARSGHSTVGSFGEGVTSVQGNVTGSVASVTGAVGSVTGAVGSVTGSVGSVTGAVGSVTAGVTVTTNNDKTGYGLATGAITAATIATDAIGADELAATGITEIQSGLSTLTSAQVNTECDTALSDVGLTSTVTSRIDAAISSRLATAGYTAPLDAAGTRTAVGLAAANLDTQLGTIDDYVDSEVSSIKTVTDHLATALELDGSVYRFTTNALEQAPTGSGGSCDEASIADAVWDELLADHVISGSAGAGLAAAQSAGDPWSTLLPGSYTTGTAGLQLSTIYSRLGSMRLTVQNPVASDGTLTLVQGDDYSSTSSLSISRTWSGSNLTGGTMVFSAMTTAQYQAGTGTAALDSIACTFTGGTSGSTVVVTIPLTAAQTGALSPSPADDPLNYVYQIKCTTTGGKIHTLFLGSMTVKRSVD